MSKKRRQFDRAFKVEAVRLVSGWVAGTFVPVSCVAVFTVLVETVTKVTATLPAH